MDGDYNSNFKLPAGIANLSNKSRAEMIPGIRDTRDDMVTPKVFPESRFENQNFSLTHSEHSIDANDPKTEYKPEESIAMGNEATIVVRDEANKVKDCIPDFQDVINDLRLEEDPEVAFNNYYQGLLETNELIESTCCAICQE